MDGIILVNKPKGITSFDVVRKLKKILKEKRIGHTGTLDPLATGVMIVCVGRATKLVQGIEAYDKEYIAGFELGFKTDTYDTEGTVTEKANFNPLSLETFNTILPKFKGAIKQIPPMYSALKVDGKRLYDLAREGIVIDRKSRDVLITKLDVLEFDGIKGKLDCSVSKGTYIRSLIFDIGEELKTFATMNELTRTRVGNIHLSQCFTLDKMEELASINDFSFINSVENFFNYPILRLVSEDDLKYYKNGNSFNFNSKDGYYSIYFKNEFLGFGEVLKNRLKLYKYFTF